MYVYVCMYFRCMYVRVYVGVSVYIYNVEGRGLHRALSSVLIALNSSLVRATQHDHCNAIKKPYAAALLPVNHFHVGS